MSLLLFRDSEFSCGMVHKQKIIANEVVRESAVTHWGETFDTFEIYMGSFLNCDKILLSMSSFWFHEPTSPKNNRADRVLIESIELNSNSGILEFIQELCRKCNPLTKNKIKSTNIFPLGRYQQCSNNENGWTGYSGSGNFVYPH